MRNADDKDLGFFQVLEGFLVILLVYNLILNLCFFGLVEQDVNIVIGRIIEMDFDSMPAKTKNIMPPMLPTPIIPTFFTSRRSSSGMTTVLTPEPREVTGLDE